MIAPVGLPEEVEEVVFVTSVVEPSCGGTHTSEMTEVVQGE